MKILFFILANLVVYSQWKYYSFDLSASRVYPYSFTVDKEVLLEKIGEIEGNLKYAGVGEIVKEKEGEEGVFVVGNEFRVYNLKDFSLLYREVVEDLGTVIIEDIDGDGSNEVVVGGREGEEWGIFVFKLSIQESAVVGTLTYKLLVGTLSVGKSRVQPRTIRDIDLDGRLDVLLTVGIGENYRVGWVGLWDYASKTQKFMVNIDKMKKEEPQGGYAAIVLSSGSPYIPKSIAEVDEDGYVMGFDSKGTLCYKISTGSWYRNTLLANIDSQGVEEMVIVQGPPAQSKIYIVDSYTGQEVGFKKETQTVFYRYQAEGVSFLSSAAADIDGDKVPEIIVGCSDKKLLILDNTLKEKATMSFDAIPYIRVLNDVNSDGFVDMVISCEDKILVVNPFLEVLGSVTLPATAEEVILSDIDCDNTNEIIASCKDGKSYVICLFGKPEGTPQVLAAAQTKYLPTSVEVYPGIVNDDDTVDGGDILGILKHWGSRGPKREGGTSWGAWRVNLWEPVGATFADTNGDGVVNEFDILGIAENWQKKISQDKVRFAESRKTSDTMLGCDENIERLQKMYRVLKESSVSNKSEVTNELVKLLNISYRRAKPNETKVLVAYPNPSRGECWIPFKLSFEATEIILKIYNVSGQLIQVVKLSGNFKPAKYYACKDDSGLLIKTNDKIDERCSAIYWDGKDASGNIQPAGVYIYQLIVKGQGNVVVSTNRLVRF